MATISNRNKNCIALIFYSFICFFAAIILSFDVGKEIKKALPNKGGEVGPIYIDKANTVYEMRVRQSVPLNQWSYVEVEVLDENKDYLFSFSDEFWQEEGYDSEGYYWKEAVDSFEMEMVFPEKGNYYFKILGQPSGSNIDKITVSTTRELGSNLAFIWQGILSFVLGLAFLRGNS